MNECERRDQAWPLFLKTYSRLVDVLENELQEATGLPLGWFEVLLQLQDVPKGRLPMHELAETLLLSRSGITRLIDRMSDAGFIERAACDDDRRIVYAAITRRGKAEYNKASRIAFRSIEENFSGVLNPSELRSFRSTLEKLLDHAEAGRQTRAAS